MLASYAVGCDRRGWQIRLSIPVIVVVTDDPVLASELQYFQSECDAPSSFLTAQYLLKIIAYHVLTEPHLHRFTRSAYELFGRHQPLPRPTSLDELRGMRPPGYERRLANAQAALGLRQLRRLDANLGHRRRVARHYRLLLSQQGVAPLEVSERSQPSYVRYPIWVADRDAAVRATACYTVLGTWFTSVLEEAISPTYGDYRAGSCPNAEDAAKHLVNLPTHPRVSLRDADVIVAALARAR